MGRDTDWICSDCHSTSRTREDIVEHDCGYIDSRDAIADGCPKCGATPTERTCRPVRTISRCLACGARSDPVSETVDELPTGATVSFPELPTPERQLHWIPKRFLPESERGQQLIASAFVVVVVSAGLVGAVSVVPVLQNDGGGPGSVDAVDRNWVEYETLVMFRNDDIQPWYNYEQLRSVNQVFVEEDVPVTLGIIPKVGDESALTADERVCDHLRTLETEYPGHFEMALHGYTHEEQTDFYDGSEFGDVPYTTQQEWLDDGANLLEKCVNEPSGTFIPPQNTYDNGTVRALVESEYTVVSGGEWFTAMYYENDSYFEADGLVHVPETQAFENWSAADANATDVPFHDLETLTASFDDARENNEIFVAMLHYQYFTSDERLETLRSLIRHAKSAGDVGFVTVEQFGVGLEAGEIERTDDGWRVLEPIAETTQSEPASESESDDRADPSNGSESNEPSNAIADRVAVNAIDRVPGTPHITGGVIGA